MKFDELTPENWTLFAIKNYNNPQSVTYADFEEDIKKFKYIKRLFRRFETTGELKKHLFYKIEKNYWPVMKAFLLFLDRLPLSLNKDVNTECLKELNLI